MFFTDFLFGGAEDPHGYSSPISDLVLSTVISVTDFLFGGGSAMMFVIEHTFSCLLVPLFVLFF